MPERPPELSVSPELLDPLPKNAPVVRLSIRTLRGSHIHDANHVRPDEDPDDVRRKAIHTHFKLFYGYILPKSPMTGEEPQREEPVIAL